jgi:predicted DNA-binding transcriptional regulator AlpA
MQPDTLNDQPRSTVPDDDRFVTTKEAAAFLGLSVIQLDVWRSKNQGPPYSRLTRQVRYRICDLIAFMDARKVRPGEDAAA